MAKKTKKIGKIITVRRIEHPEWGSAVLINSQGAFCRDWMWPLSFERLYGFLPPFNGTVKFEIREIITDKPKAKKPRHKKNRKVRRK